MIVLYFHKNVWLYFPLCNFILENSDEVKNLLTNPHLRDLLVTIDQAENAEQIMQKAMLEAIFVEFADACIKAVEPSNTNQDQAQDQT